jgi:hypothetical protein
VALISTGLGNMPVRSGQWVAMHILPKKDGYIVADRCQWIINNPSDKLNLGQAGYAMGFRGTYVEFFEEDNGGKPGNPLSRYGSRSVLAAELHEHGNGIFPLVEFQPIEVKAGVPIWRCWQNIDRDSVNNWASLDFLMGDYTQCEDMQLWRNISGVWRQETGYLPSPYVMFYDDGDWQGYGGVEVVNGAVVIGTEYGFPAGS